MNIILANTSQQNAESIGYMVGVILGIIIMIGSPILMIYSIFKLIKTKHKAWIIGIIIPGIPTSIFFVGLVAGMIQGFQNQGNYIDEGRIIPGDRIVSIIGGGIKTKVPSHWTMMKELNEGAVFQAGNLVDEEYAIIIKYSKEDFDGELIDVNEYTNMELVDSLYESDVISTDKIQINGLNAYTSRINGTINNLRICYLNTVIEGSNDYYQVLGWTLNSKKEKAIPILTEFTNSIIEQGGI